MTWVQGKDNGGDPRQWQDPQAPHASQGYGAPGQGGYGPPGDAPEGDGPPGYGPPGYGPQGYAPPGHEYTPGTPGRSGGPGGPGGGTRMLAFLTRDIAALVAATVTVVSGLILLVTPSLAWIRDSSTSLVEGSMSVSARGSVSLSSLAERSLSESDALELGFMELGIQTVLGPVAGMLMLSGLLVIVGGLLMLTTARQLGAVVALMGVIPQLLAVAVGVLTTVMFSDSSSSPQAPSGPSPSPDPGFSAGAGFYTTIIVYAVVIICVAVVALRPERGPRASARSGPTGQSPGPRPFGG